MSMTHIATWNAGTLQNAAAIGRRHGGILAGTGLRSRKMSSDRIQHALVLRAAHQQPQAGSAEIRRGA